MARLIEPFEQFFDASGDPLAFGLLDFYEAGGSTVRKATYADSAETIANSNPVVLNGDGRAPNVFGSGRYRVIVRTAQGSQISQREIGGVDALNFGSEWIVTQTYSVGDVVRENGEYWESQVSGNLGNTPSSDGGANWLLFLGQKASLSGAAFTGAISTITTNTALSDADATLTAAQLIGGEFTITPSVARTLTTDTAANIIAALSGSVDNSSFEFTIVNLAAFNVTVAAGTGVTLVGNMLVNNGSATFRVRRLTSSTVSVTRLETGYSSQTLIIQDQKPSGVSGGASVAGSQVRVLNTIIKNTISGASLASNQITLPAGEYEITASAPAFITDNHSIEFYNVTDATTVLFGTNEYCGNTTMPQTRSFIDSGFIIDSAKVFELVHLTQTAFSSGLGGSTIGRTPEVYSQVKIKKVG